jgi:hypothetical protein
MKRIHKYGRLVLLSTVLIVMNTAVAICQSSGGSFTITTQVVAGGGCAPDGSGGCTPSIGSGNLVVTGTAAQPGAADLSRQPPYSVRGGFWYASLAATPTAANGMVSGTIFDSNGNPVAGAVIRLSGTQNRKTITDADGHYSFVNVETSGFYTVTPARANYNFSPFNRSFSQTGNQTEAAFTAESTGDNANPLDTAEYFVRQQYVDVLGREVDEAGFNYWSDKILDCKEDARCMNSARRDVASAFFISDENQASGAYICDVYSGSLGRRPAFSEYSLDRTQVAGGVAMDREKTTFAQKFVQHPEFLTRYQNALTAESFVDALLKSVQASGVDLSGERANLIGTYNQGGAEPVVGRAAVVRAVADNAVFKQSQYNQSFVLTEYFAYLRRDFDLDGYDFWVGVLNAGDPSNYPRMVCSFITSREYQSRFSHVETHSNGECSGQ